MPCYQVQTASVELNNADHELLEKALKKQGYTVFRQGNNLTFSKGNISGSYRNNKLMLNAPQDVKIDTDAIKRSYSESVIELKARQYAEEGWEMTQDGDEYIFRRSPGYGAIYA